MCYEEKNTLSLDLTLFVVLTKNFFFYIHSAIIEHTKRVIFLEDGDVALVRDGSNMNKYFLILTCSSFYGYKDACVL